VLVLWRIEREVETPRFALGRGLREAGPCILGGQGLKLRCLAYSNIPSQKKK
jgi:hypothetical protein